MAIVGEIQPTIDPVAAWAHSQAPRLIRTKWNGNPELEIAPKIDNMAEELYIILSRWPTVSTGNVSLVAGGTQFPALELPPFSDLSIPELDLGIPDFPDLQPYRKDTTEETNDPNGSTTVSVKYSHQRDIMPCKIISGAAFSYMGKIYPLGIKKGNGESDGTEVKYDDKFQPNEATDVPEASKTATVLVQQLQAVAGAVIPPGTWVWVWRVIEVEVVKITQKDIKTGEIISESTNVKATVMQNLICAPVWM